jgi:TonB family protein
MTRLKHILLSLILLTGALHAADPERTLVKRVEPEYPEIAAQMNLHGTVKLKIWISPEGAVRRLEYVGGHPLLAESGLKAVRTWKYQTASQESTTVVELKF